MIPRSPFAKLLTTILVAASLSGLSPLLGQDQEKAKETEKEKPARITEEILVTGKKPKDQPVATVTTIDSLVIRLERPRDLAEVLRYAPGAMVTFGNKEEYNLKLRGFDNKRVALLVDGVPVIDPYYSSFDLKTVSSGGIQSIQITKGPSSVLYGPNTLGGIVNVITRRPGPEPKLALNASYGDRKTGSVGMDASYLWNKIGLVGEALYQDSGGFYYNAGGTRSPRTNSDYTRLNLNAKVYYMPSSDAEFMLNAGYYHSDYGMPPDLYNSKPRYWRFPKWDRTTLNAGGFTSLGGGSTLQFRAFYVNYYNTLDQFKDPAMTSRQFESTFDNSVYGAFGIGDFKLNGWNNLKVSVYYQGDRAHMQDDVNLPWTTNTQGTFSAGIEDHISLGEQWKVIGGLSFDALDKYTGNTSSRVNPLVGLKFSPDDALDFHLSYSNKSRFPSMRSLYSPSSGNPDLLSEKASMWELGGVYDRGIYLSAAIFANDLRNMIDSFRLPDGTRRYFNIGHARLNGAEFQARESWNGLDATVNYTYLDHKNVSDNRPLDVLSKHNLNFNLDITPLDRLRLAIFGLWASKSFWYDTNSKVLLNIPSYFNLEAALSYSVGRLEPFIKISNIFNKYFYTEPGFPWRGRFLEFGIRADVF
jgi:outer membrane cobalamin receptor